MAYSPYKMKGPSLYRNSSPAKITDAEKRTNLLKAVPNKEAYDKLSEENKRSFDEKAVEVGLPTKKVSKKELKNKKKSPAKIWGMIAKPVLGAAAGLMDKSIEEDEKAKQQLEDQKKK